MSIINLTSANFNEKVSSGKVLVDFWADWCMPCRMLAPVIEEIAAECEGSLTVGKVNIDIERTLANQFGISSIPTVILFNNGAETKRFIGVKPKMAYLAEIS